MTEKVDRLKKQMEQLSSSTEPIHTIQQQILDMLRSSVSFDAACFTLVDPTTLLSTGAWSDDAVEEMHPLLFELEYMTEDVNHFAELALQERPVMSLHEATWGNQADSKRYSEVLAPAGFVDELRAVLRNDGHVWGYIVLFRHMGQPLFSADDKEWLAHLSPTIGKLIQILHTRTPRSITLEQDSQYSRTFIDGTGVVVLDKELKILSTNEDGEKLLSLLRQNEQIPEQVLPRPIRAAAQRQLMLRQKQDHNERESVNKIVMRLDQGASITIRATSYTLDEAAVMVLIEPSRPAAHFERLAIAYSLTKREQQICAAVASGATTKEIASRLGISSHTVADHLKAIFAKVGVSKRGELISRLYGYHAEDGLN